ncbi:MAG: hypothetical protein CME65_07335 [Halobacteriovoraceae bacterium]|nr:hypothetical protein [Halobacteriovoraceae bacterium]|tara:strand:+ start:8436 stop:9224 length:789 start_codon:yes stop_codon:yes gene_type:complete
MKLSLFFVFLLVSTQSFAFDLNEVVNDLKAEVKSLMGEKEIETPKYQVPELPAIVNDPKSVDVYSKKGAIYKTGTKYRSLTKRERAKYQYLFLKELIYVVRGAEATDQELTNYMNVLDQGGNREGIYRSLVVSSNYQELEMYQQSPSQRVLDFTQEYAVKYLRVNYEVTKMKDYNVWSIKRLLVDRTLEQIDAFPKDGKDLYIWYAVLSEELAKRFAIWKNKVRSNTNPDTHIKWAQSVPFQHLKSEVIIKLNKVFNYLQEK